MLNASNLARSAYTKAAAIAPSLPEVEYRAFSEVTRRLRESGKNPNANFAALAEAVHLNQRLWLILASDVASESNELPEQLRAQLFYLCEFTRAHSSRVLAGEASTEALVDINTAVMRGLRGDDAQVAS